MTARRLLDSSRKLPNSTEPGRNSTEIPPLSRQTLPDGATQSENSRPPPVSKPKKSQPNPQQRWTKRRKEEETQLSKSKLAKDRPQTNEDTVGISLSVAVGMGELLGCVERNKRTNCEAAGALKQRTAERDGNTPSLGLSFRPTPVPFSFQRRGRVEQMLMQKKRRKKRNGRAVRHCR